MKVLIKAMRPHRQKVLTEDGQEMRLQQWANKTASAALRGAGGEASGEQFQQARDALMREAVANPDEHGLKFMGERMPFEGQTLEESLSEPDVEGEQAAVDQEFAPEKPETPDIFDEQGKLRQTLPRGNKYTNVSYDANVYTPTEEEKNQMMEEKQKEFDANAEAEHLRRIMTSRDVAIRDAWSVLKFGYPAVPGMEIPEEVKARHNISPTTQGPYDREGRYLEHQDINLCPEAKAYLASGQRMDKDPNFCNNCDFCYGK